MREIAEKIHALINSRPQSPTIAEILALLEAQPPMVSVHDLAIVTYPGGLTTIDHAWDEHLGPILDWGQ